MPSRCGRPWRLGAEPGAFDLAVVDIGLPGQDGIAFCRQFRRHAAGRHAIILLVTADERAETLEAALEAGAHDYVIKPIERRRFAVRLAIAEQRSLANATSRYSREALRESEHRFEAFMTNSPALAFIKDAHGRFLYVNRRYLEVFGITESEVIGRTVHEIFDEAIATPLLANDVDVIAHGPREDHRGGAAARRAAPLAHLQVPAGRHRRARTRWSRASPSTSRIGCAPKRRCAPRRRAPKRCCRWPARSTASATSPRFSRASATTRVRRSASTWSASCCTCRRRSGWSWRRCPVERRPCGRFSPASRTKPAPGRSPRTTWSSSGMSAMAQLPQLARLARLGLKSAAFVRMVRDGEYLGAMGVASLEHLRTFSADDVALLQGVADQAAMAIRNARLLDERRRSEEQMRNAQKLESLGVLAGGIAHDFNNLLVGVLGNAGLALLELPEDSPARQPIRDIEVSAQRAAELTRQMLAYSGRGRFRVEPVDLSSVVEEMSQLLRRVISKQTQLSLAPGPRRARPWSPTSRSCARW